MLRKSGRILFCSYRRQTVEIGLAICPHSGECSYDLFGSGYAGLGYAKGELIIDLVREANSLQDAIATAIHDAEKIDGIHIDRIEIHNDSETEFMEGQEIVNSILKLRRLTQKKSVDQFWELIDTA